MNNTRTKRRILYLCQAGLVAALYVVLTMAVGAIGLSGGAIQLRVSEALCVLVAFMPAAIPGLTVGCLVANLATACLWQDVLFGTLATLIGALGGRLLRKHAYLVPLPTVLANTVIVPLVLAYAYHAPEGLGFLVLTVGAGEILSAYVLGLALLFALRRHGRRLFGEW
ncbi:MAG: QueT transporter family protein [Clostridia bacterium]|nr:QueT transporter family protein [Clostridia bacterium]